MRKVWISCIGECWRGFKIQLTADYIKNPKVNLKHLLVKCSFIDQNTLDKFRKSRNFLEFKVIRSLSNIWCMLLCWRFNIFIIVLVKILRLSSLVIEGSLLLLLCLVGAFYNRLRVKKGRENVAKNKYPYKLSRGWYEKLKKIMMIKKRKQRQEELTNASLSLFLGSPPLPCHEKCKRSRQIPSGEYTSEAIHVVFGKIISIFFCQEY